MYVNKKLIAIATALCISLILLCTTLAIVLVATGQNISNDITINYDTYPIFEIIEWPDDVNYATDVANIDELANTEIVNNTINNPVGPVISNKQFIGWLDVESNQKITSWPFDIGQGDDIKTIAPMYVDASYGLLYSLNPDIEGTLMVYTYYGSDTSVVIPEYYSGEITENGSFTGMYSGEVTAIADYAFSNEFSNTRITEVDLPDTVVTIGDYAFAGCGDLTSIDSKGTIIDIGNGAFGGCSQLSGIDLTNVKRIGSMAFMTAGIESLIIPASVTYLGAEFVSGCNKLTSLVFEHNDTTQFEYSSNGSEWMTLGRVEYNSHATCDKCNGDGCDQCVNGEIWATEAFQSTIFDSSRHDWFRYETMVTIVGSGDDYHDLFDFYFCNNHLRVKSV